MGLLLVLAKFGIELTKVSPAYTSVVGVTKYMAMYRLNSGESAALVIARRGESSPEGGFPSALNWRTRKGQGRTEKLPKYHVTFFKKPEDFLKPDSWKKVARKINIIGGANRHRWYSYGKKQLITNSFLYSKLRQTNVTRRDTVQLLDSPHIKVKN